jgi:hypothetical protein
VNESRRELVDRLLTFTGELNDSSARTVAEGLLNHVLLQFWLRHPFRSFMMPAPYELVTAAGTRTYILPSYFGRVAAKEGRIRNLTTGQLLEPRDGQDLYLEHPEAGTSVDTGRGDPTEFSIAGVAGVLDAGRECRRRARGAVGQRARRRRAGRHRRPRQHRRLHRGRVHVERRGRRRRGHVAAGAELQQELAAEHQRADVGADTERGAGLHLEPRQRLAAVVRSTTSRSIRSCSRSSRCGSTTP